MSRYRCPQCHNPLPDGLEHGSTVSCSSCRSDFSFVADPVSGAEGLVELGARDTSRPLFLPRGSIRALATLATAASSWYLVFRGMDLPEYLLAVLLAIMASYFAYRRAGEEVESSIADARRSPDRPLFLPHGWIRWTLALGFAASACFLFFREKLGERKYVEFYAVLASLLAGYMVGKLLFPLRGGILHAALNHLKALGVLAATAYLTYLLFTGEHAQQGTLALALASAISFYFGSR